MSTSVGHRIPATRLRRWSVGRRSLLVAAIVILPAWVISGTSSGTRTVVTGFDFTGAAQVYLVPAGVCRIRIEAVGAAGGERGTAGTPGLGARALATLRVTPGEPLHVHVGGWGGTAVGRAPGRGGWNGGGDGGAASERRRGQAGKAGSGGGGATDVRQGGGGLEHRIIVGGGGSGGAGGGIGGPIGYGGGGGGVTGGEGFALLGSVNAATGGEGGTHNEGGAPGRNAPDLSVTATAGLLGSGGSGASGGASGGGGGGGGFYGGGGGGSSRFFSGGPGGGGSGDGPAETVFMTGVGGGFGHARISYDPDRDACDNARGTP